MPTFCSRTVLASDLCYLGRNYTYVLCKQISTLIPPSFSIYVTKLCCFHNESKWRSRIENYLLASGRKPPRLWMGLAPREGRPQHHLKATRDSVKLYWFWYVIQDDENATSLYCAICTLITVEFRSSVRTWRPGLSTVCNLYLTYWYNIIINSSKLTRAPLATTQFRVC